MILPIPIKDEAIDRSKCSCHRFYVFFEVKAALSIFQVFRCIRNSCLQS